MIFLEEGRSVEMGGVVKISKSIDFLPISIFLVLFFFLLLLINQILVKLVHTKLNNETKNN